MSQEITLTGANLRTKASINLTNNFTVAFWMKPVAAPVGVIMAHANRFTLSWQAGGVIRLVTFWTSNGQWDTAAVGNITRWRLVVLTYGFGSTANNPTMYFMDTTNGVDISVKAFTRTVGPTGAPIGSPGVFTIGNNTAGTNTCMGQKYSEVLGWTELLVPSDINRFVFGGPLMMPRELITWWSLKRPETVIAGPGWEIYDESGYGNTMDIAGCTHFKDDPEQRHGVGAQVNG